MPRPSRRFPAPFARIACGLRRWPGPAGWRFAAGQALWLLPALALLGWAGGILVWRPALGVETWTLLAVAILFPVLAEESLFRAAMIPPKGEGNGGWRPSALSLLLFTLWHPVQSLLYSVPWSALAFDPWFLASVALLGLACSRIWVRTASLWPCIFLHWSVVALWKALFGARLELPLV